MFYYVLPQPPDVEQREMRRKNLVVLGAHFLCPRSAASATARARALTGRTSESTWPTSPTPPAISRKTLTRRSKPTSSNCCGDSFDILAAARLCCRCCRWRKGGRRPLETYRPGGQGGGVTLMPLQANCRAAKGALLILLS